MICFIEKQKMEKIWDRIPADLSIHEMEKEFIRQAVAAGISKEKAEEFVLGGDI